MLEFNPYHVLVACIFLAAKTERGKGQLITHFVQQFMMSVEEKNRELFLDLALEKDTPRAAAYHIG